ncbi:Heavy metal-associated domain, HMA [Sesbania bispinosa]|nr:Heavy metal-associated domain, HMA [Sesbania bispinosa]
MDQASCSSSNVIQLGGRTIDRHNPIINDSRRSTSRAPCSSSQPPIDPKPYQKTKIKNSSSKPNGQNKINATKVHKQKKKSTAEKLTEHVTTVSSCSSDETNPAFKPSSSSCLKSAGSSDQVVVLKVSLHCKGCEGKVRKHLSRMQGVTSFNIDFAARW